MTLIERLLDQAEINALNDEADHDLYVEREERLCWTADQVAFQLDVPVDHALIVEIGRLWEQASSHWPPTPAGQQPISDDEIPF